jgi:hypothetical protein
MVPGNCIKLKTAVYLYFRYDVIELQVVKMR